MSVKHELHVLMQKHFGEAANEKSHSWLRGQTGKCHVSECSVTEVKRAVRKLASRQRHWPKVRPGTWAKL